jgi:drug/metabolite transporter (DMT)-like permease
LTVPIGELAALATSVCWSLTSIFFTLSGRQVGSAVVNRTRLLMALVIIGLVHWIVFGELFPIHAPASRWGWMALSGIIGFVIGDAMLFQAFVMIGPRLSMLLMALNPVMGAAMAWVLLAEKLTAVELSGILLTIGGVAWVVSDRTEKANSGFSDLPPRYYLVGILFGLGGALGQASGMIASKRGLQGDFPALSGTLIRLTASTILIWAITAASGQTRTSFQKLREHPQAFRIILVGAIAGPAVGVWLSLVAVQNAPVGVASTLASLTPIILLPIGRIFFNERITQRAVAGTTLAMIGTALLFLKP